MKRITNLCAALIFSAALSPVLADDGGDRLTPTDLASAATKLDLQPGAFTVQRLALPTPDQPGFMQVICGPDAIDLVLQPVHTRAANFRLIVEADGVQTITQPPTEASFFAAASNRPGVSAAINIYNGSVRATIMFDDRVWYVQPLSEVGVGTSAEMHAVFPGDAVITPHNECPGAVPVPGVISQAATGMIKGTGFCRRECQIAFDADFLYYQQNGSSTVNTQADIDSVVNAMNLIYARDIGATFATTSTIIRTAAGLYGTSNINTLLTSFKDEWNANNAAITRDIAHLMTGQPTGTTIGLAYNDAVCSPSFAYGVSQSRFSTNFSNRVALSAHEIGHNFSASHCDGDSDCSIMCSVVNQCAHDTGKFSLRSINEMRPRAQSVYTCLAQVAGWATAVAPKAMPDTAQVPQTASVDIDVCNNDYDGNCTDVVSVATFQASTVNGGAITRLIGAGPGGRDLLRYTAGASFVGTDTFTYSVSDAGGSTSTTVSVTVTAPRSPDYFGLTQGGLESMYYRLSGRNSVPPTTGLFNYANGSGTNFAINFPSTAGQIFNSGNADNFLAVFNASLTVPTTGTYTLFTQSDEGSLLFIDGALVVNNDYVHTSQERSGTLSLTAGSHALRLEYFELTGNAELILRWQGPSITKQVIPGNRLVGLTANYYNLPNPLSAMPNFASLTGTPGAAITSINFPATAGDFAGSARAEDVGAVFTGYLNVPTAGIYTLYAESADGSRITIGNTVVVNNDGIHGMAETSGQIALLPGNHTLKVEYFGAGGTSGLIARWEGPGIAKQIIPAFNLKRVGTSCGPADVGSQGGTAGADGVLDNNDFVAFINFFFAGC